jgi:hypothetical protein
MGGVLRAFLGLNELVEIRQRLRDGAPHLALVRRDDEGAGAELGEFHGFRGIRNHHADRLADVVCGCNHAVDGVANRGVGGRFGAERDGEITTANEEAVNSLDRCDGVDVIQRLGVLDHRNGANRCILFVDQAPHRRGAIAPGAGRA